VYPGPGEGGITARGARAPIPIPTEIRGAAHNAPAAKIIVAIAFFISLASLHSYKGKEFATL
jgi:hypothetical protein